MQEIADLTTRIADIERRISGMIRHGTVHEVGGGKVRLRVGGTYAAPFLSPAIPYAQVAGDIKAHVPPSVGQQMTIIAPTGDWRQGVAIPLTWSDENPSPSVKGDEAVVTLGDFTITLHADVLTVEGPKVVVKSQNVCLGDEGGKKVARVGDLVQVSSGSSTGLWPIIEGSSRVTAAD